MKRTLPLRSLSLAVFLATALLGCVANKQTFRGPGHDADWPIEAPNSPAFEAFVKAKTYSQRGDVDEAIEAYQEALKHEPGSAQIHLGLAFELTRKGDFVRAEQMTHKAIGISPELRDAHMLMGKIHAARQDWNQAELDFKKAISLDEEREEEAVIALASVYVDAKRAQEAANLLESFLERNPGSMFGFYYLGRVYSELNRPEDALKTYEKSLQINPGFSSALKAMGLIYEYQGKKREAIQAFEKILEIQPDNVGIRNHLSQLYLDEKEYHQAKKQLELVVEEQPDNYTARLRLGLLYLQHDDLENSEKTLRKLLGDVPQKDRVQYYLGVVLEKRGNRPGALAEFKAIEPGSDSYVDGRLAISLLLEQGNDLEGAEKFLREGLKKAPDSSLLIAALADVLSKRNQIRDAENLLKTALSKNEKDEILWFALGELYDKAKDLRGLDEAMRKVIAINPDNAQALNYLGYSYADRGINLEEAEKLIRRALAIKPKDGYITDSLGWIFFKRKQFDQAVRTLEEATQLIPDEPVILEHFADALVELGRSEQAREVYEKATGLTKDESDRKRIREKIDKIHRP